MIFREASTDDIAPMHAVRTAVKENILSNPLLVTDAHYTRLLTLDGKGWVCEVDHHVAGFAIVDSKRSSVWALFVHPDHEGQGIGRTLHQRMLDWYFDRYRGSLWLTTGAGTRAEAFYQRAGWAATGIEANGEIRFEITAMEWEEKRTLPGSVL